MTAMFSGNHRSLAVLCAAAVLCLATPLSRAMAQDAPLIDLGPIMNAPLDSVAEPAALPEAAPLAPLVPQTPPPPVTVEVPDETLLTLPDFDRTGTVDAADAQDPGSILLPIQAVRPTLNGIVRLTGEVQREDFFIDLPLIAAPQDLVLTYRIAINVLPEESQLRVTVNGVDLPPIQPRAFEGFEPIILPGNLLKDGRNDITVRVYHAHRIFCGPDATFAVWSEINTNTSGVRMTRASLPDDAAGLRMALRAQVAMAGTLGVRVSDDLSADTVIAALGPRLTGLRGSGPVVMVAETPYGVVDGPAPMARITARTGPTPRIDVRRVGDGALVMLLTIGFDGTLPDLESFLPLPAPVENSALLMPDTPTALRDLGFDQPEAYNRYTEQTITFRMPDDWLLMASQKGMLELGYSFADGLPTGALMLVKMNDTTISLLPLDRDGGQTLPRLDVDFRARLLRPGANALTFVTIVPGDPPDLHCPPLTGPLVVVSPDTTIMVPASPRMRSADVARPLAAVQPDQIRAIAGAANGGTDASAAADAGLAAVLATALRPINQSPRIESASLTVVAEDAAARIDLSDLGVSRRDLAEVLKPVVVAPVDPNAPVSQPEAPGIIDRTTGAVRDVFASLVQSAVPDDGPLAVWLIGRQAEAIVFLPDDDAPDALWLMVRGTADAQRLAGVLAQARLSATGPRGRVALLTPEGTWQSWQSSRTAPQLLEPLTIANFRVVAGNYASWSPLYYGALMFVLTLVSVFLALVFVISTRGKRKK